MRNLYKKADILGAEHKQRAVIFQAIDTDSDSFLSFQEFLHYI